MPRGRIAVVIEEGAHRTFASAIDWPGWCRNARGVDAALAALAGYRDRYAPVARRAKLQVPEPVFDVVETGDGTRTTDFGAPDVIADADQRRLDRAHAARLVSVLRACWAELDAVAGHAPKSLRKGPRGGGRDRDAMVEHVVDTERAYARKIGVRVTAEEWRSGGSALLRERVAEALLVPSDGTAPVDRGWPHRYFIRRTAWHALDHAWEMQDRS